MYAGASFCKHNRSIKVGEAAFNSPAITLRDRLEVGNLSVDEVCFLKRRSRSGFYQDVKAGLVEIRKQGRNTVVPGPIARRYINNESVAA
jgi:hypothetical protein